jgi:hypothetical protein
VNIVPSILKRTSLFFVGFLLGIIWAAGNLWAQPLFTIHFEDGEVGKFPPGWSSRNPAKMAEVYSVQAENGNQFLHADAQKISVPIAHERKWELKEYPILRWRWRAILFPEGTDERRKSGNDNVLAVYAIFGGWPIPTTIKYVWSDVLATGSSFDSPLSDKTKIIVVRGGRKDANRWVAEERNLLADYRRLFSAPESNPVARGIILLTDSDDSRTRSVGDYDDIAVMSKR